MSGLNYYFPQGQTFSLAVAIEMPHLSHIFQDWDLTCELRKFRDNSPSGLVARPTVTKLEGPGTCLLLYHEDTSKWPVGRLEFHVELEHPSGGYKLRTLKQEINIIR